MILREYKYEDKQDCIEVFSSNCPKFLHNSELDLFINWLDHRADKNGGYKSSRYTKSEKEAYFVIEHFQGGIIGCGGFYIIKDKPEARLAWGMIHADFHKQGYGTTLFYYRAGIIKKKWPNHTIKLMTSQHTYLFYKKMGMMVTASRKAGYGPDLDKYDMIMQADK